MQVIHHGRPAWLGRMHLDVWIPELKIAVEYHGPQHFEMVEHFGGAEAFKKTKRRDNLKRLACLREGVQLIEVLSLDEMPKILDAIRRANSVG